MTLHLKRYVIQYHPIYNMIHYNPIGFKGKNSPGNNRTWNLPETNKIIH